MTRGNQRDKDRERAQARKEKNDKKTGSNAPKLGGRNTDADALAAKIAAKKAAKEAGVFKEKAKAAGKKPSQKSKSPSMINPHTGKRDPAYTEKMLRKQQK